MTDNTSHVHIYLPQLEPGTQLHIHIGAVEATDNETSDEVAVKAMLKRLADFANGSNVHALYEGLLDLGYKPNVPAIRKEGKTQEAYLRWTDPANPRPAVLYFDTASANFARKADRELLTGLPGAQTTDRLVRFSIGTTEGVEQTLAAAKLVKG